MNININSQKYKIIKQLGEGGFGKVFLVSKEDKFYAIKQLSIKNLSEEEIEMAENEAKILSNIKNDHIVKYYDSYKDIDNFNILMEYCENDLRKFIDEHKAKKELIEENIIYDIILDLILGIKEIHKNNIIHRDLKPANIFINKENKIKIGDFGISKQLDNGEKYASTNTGTNYYMAPEIIKGEQYNNKIDIWALGCIIYELFTLNICFKTKSIYGYVNKIVEGYHGTIDIKKYNSKWQKLIDLLLKKDYKKRPNIDEVYNYLNNSLKNYIITHFKDVYNAKNYIEELNKFGEKQKLKRIKPEEAEQLRNEGIKIHLMKSKKLIFNQIFIKYSISIRMFYSWRKNKFN